MKPILEKKYYSNSENSNTHDKKYVHSIFLIETPGLYSFLNIIDK